VRKLFEEEHPAVRWAVESLWRLVIQQGKLPEAEAISRDRVERLRTRLPADDPKLADALWRLADSLLNQQRFAEAEPPAREALAIKEKKCPDDWWKFSQRTILGNCLLGQKKYAEAEPLFLSGYEGMKHERKGPKDRQRSSWRALQCLARICELTGRSDEAAKWRGILHREQVEWSKRAGDANDAEALNNLAWLLATSPDPELRDGPRAVESAEKALAATKRRNVRYLGTLAAAYAEAGDFGKAVSTQKEAMALLTDEKTKADFASRLKLYESNTPYREP
jgi:tetratricopeptide (TPR) repeat protein